MTETTCAALAMQAMTADALQSFFQRKTVAELKKYISETNQKWKGISKWKKEDYVKALVEHALTQAPAPVPAPTATQIEPVSVVEETPPTPPPVLTSPATAPVPVIIKTGKVITFAQRKRVLDAKKKPSTSPSPPITQPFAPEWKAWRNKMSTACAEFRRRAAFPKWNYEMSQVLDELTKGNRMEVADIVFNVIDGQCTLAPLAIAI